MMHVFVFLCGTGTVVFGVPADSATGLDLQQGWVMRPNVFSAALLRRQP